MFKRTITNAQWAAIAPLLPAEPLDEQPKNRDFTDGFLWLWGSGSLWEDWPAELGSSTAAFHRVMGWTRQGLLAKLRAHFPPGSEQEQLLGSADDEITALYAPITEQEWAIYEPLLPAASEKPDNRTFLQELLWQLGTGSQWAYWPTELGSPTRARVRALSWEMQGVFQRLAAHIPPDSKRGEVMQEVCKYGVKAMTSDAQLT